MYVCSHCFVVNFQTAKLLGSKRVSPTFCVKFRTFKIEFPRNKSTLFGGQGFKFKEICDILRQVGAFEFPLTKKVEKLQNHSS